MIIAARIPLTLLATVPLFSFPVRAQNSVPNPAISVQKIADLTRAIAAEPQDPTLYAARSLAYGAIGDYLKAENDRVKLRFFARGDRKPLLKLLADFQALSKQSPKNAGFYLHIGDLHSYLGNNEAALQSFNRAVALDPKSAYGFASRGAIYFNLGNHSRSLADFNRAGTLRPRFSWPFQGRGEILSARNQHEKAIAQFNRAIAIAPDDAPSYRGRSRAYVALKKFDLARADVNRAINLRPEAQAFFERAALERARKRLPLESSNMRVGLALAPNDANLWLYRAQTLMEGGDYPTARLALDRAAKIAPDNPTIFLMRALSFPALQNKTGAVADYNRAVALLSRQIARQPRIASLYLERGFVFEALGKIGEAISDYTRAQHLATTPSDAGNRLKLIQKNREIAANSTSPTLFVERARIHSALGDPVSAEADYSRALQIAPKNGALRLARGMFHLGESNLRKEGGSLEARGRAKNDFDAALALNPNLMAARRNRLPLLYDDAKILADATLVLKNSPDDVVALTERAETFAEAGEKEKALADLNRAVKFEPTNAKIRVLRGKMLYHSGQLQEAENDLKLAARIPGSNFGFEVDIQNYLRLIALDRAVAAEPKNAAHAESRAQILVNLDTLGLGLYNLEREDGDSYSLFQRANSSRFKKAITDSAIADLSRAIALAPRKTSPLILRARLYDRAHGDLKLAIADVSAAIALDSQSAKVFNQRGNLHFRSGDYAAAVADYLSATRLDAGYAPGLYGRDLYQDDEEYEKAVAFFTAEIARSPRDAQLYLARAVMHADRPGSSAKDSTTTRLQAAIADFSQAIELDPTLSIAFTLRGIAREALDSHLESESDSKTSKNPETSPSRGQILADYDEAIRLDAANAVAYLRRARFLSEEKPEQAFADFSKVIALAPKGTSAAFAARAAIFQKQKNWKAAAADLESALRLETSIEAKHSSGFHSQLQYQLATAYLNAGYTERAITVYTSLLKNPPPYSTPAAGYKDRGLAYMANKNWPEALADFDAALDSAPDSYDLYEARAMVYRQLGQIERAAMDELLVKLLKK